MTWLIELGQTQQFPLIPVVGQDSFTGAVEQARDLNINNFNLLDDEDKNRKTKLSYIPSLLPHKVSNITHSMREVTVSDHEDSTTAAPLHAREPMINKEASEAQPRKQSDILHKVVVDNLHPKCTLEDLAVIVSKLFDFEPAQYEKVTSQFEPDAIAIEISLESVEQGEAMVEMLHGCEADGHTLHVTLKQIDIQQTREEARSTILALASRQNREHTLQSEVDHNTRTTTADPGLKNTTVSASVRKSAVTAHAQAKSNSSSSTFSSQIRLPASKQITPNIAALPSSNQLPQGKLTSAPFKENSITSAMYNAPQEVAVQVEPAYMPRGTFNTNQHYPESCTHQPYISPHSAVLPWPNIGPSVPAAAFSTAMVPSFYPIYPGNAQLPMGLVMHTVVEHHHYFGQPYPAQWNYNRFSGGYRPSAHCCSRNDGSVQ